jgi:DNA primase
MTDVFTKREVLLGLGEATRSPAPACVLTEGPLDAIAVSLARPNGFAALALCGTALTEHQVETIRSSNYEQVILALDDDLAGVQALEKAATTLGDRRTMAIRCPHKDPAGLFTTDGPLALSETLSAARPVAEVLLELQLAKWPDRLENAEAAIACLREAATIIAKIKPPNVATLATHLSRETKLPLLTITTELTDAISSPARARLSRTGPRVNHDHTKFHATAREPISSTPTLSR